MIPEIGQFALILALCTAIPQTILPLIGVRNNWSKWTAIAGPSAVAQFLFVAIAFACLTLSFVNNDFSVAYVAHNSNSQLPLLYKISGVWGAHEGSLLLWSLMLSIWTILVALFSKQIPPTVLARVISVMGLVSIGFLLFMLFTSNPFDRQFPAAINGADLNPLLQDPGLAIHPPLLYMGYVGFSVAFAFAIAALMSGRLDAAWARWSRPWTNIAWCFLTLGIAIGSWWAYYELGWGGWWFWDPVENASFMPWLVGTALLHSLAATEKRGAFKSWTLLLAISAFSLSLLGTFLVRSGVLTSVHAFASDPTRGIFILIFLLIVIGGSLILFASKAGNMKTVGQFDPISRETGILINNLLLSVFAAVVLFGTLFPLIMDALGQGKYSVGPPYFNFMFIPLMAPIAFFVGIGAMARWKRQSLGELVQNLKWPLALSVLIGLALPLMASGYHWQAGLGLVLATWVLLSSLTGLWLQIRKKAGKIQALTRVSAGYYGMLTAHIGVAIFVVGISMSSIYSIERDLKMAPGDKYEFGEFVAEFHGVSTAMGPNYQASRGNISIKKADKVVATLRPEKRLYLVRQMPMTEAAIDPGLTRDLYVALGEPLDDQGAWSVRIYYKPFIRWIWLGPLIMALGGLLATLDRRFRAVRQKRLAALGEVA